MIWLNSLAFGQIIERSQMFHFKESPSHRSIMMGGYLDGQNTYSHGYARNRVQVFQPMQTVSICNRGLNTVHAPRLIFNNTRRWYDNQSLLNEILYNAETENEKALALWAFFVRNRIHFPSPASNCTISNPLRLLGIYGYLTCGSASTVITSMAELMGRESRQWSLRAKTGIQHHIPEMWIKDRFVIIDMDAEVFYLDYDNETLLGRDDIVKDKYLIWRTHHYGKNRIPRIDPTVLYNNRNQSVTVSPCVGHRLDFFLRPGEAFIFDWTERSRISHEGGNPPFPIPYFIANSRFEYQPPFDQCSLDAVFDAHSNIVVSADSTESFLHADRPGQARFTIEFDSPFVFLDSEVMLDFYRTAQDSIWIEFSPNGSSWYPVWQAKKTSRITEQISLNRSLAVHKKGSRDYRFFLRFHIKTANAQDCRIYDLSIKSLVQTTTRFMPTLKLGENEIEYSDSDDSRDVEVKIRWQESIENQPPSSDFYPVFPGDGQRVNGSVFTFRWEPAGDPDADEIVDYEFMLSDHQDMRFPLSPTFNMYTSVLKSDLNAFKIPVAGFLNHDKKYYWRVRAKDEHGAWSEWSDTWSFTPKTVMLPQNVTVSPSGDEQFLTWNANPDGLPPAGYHIYGSSEQNGFIPDTTTFIGQTSDTYFKVTNDSLPFFRVAAVSSSGIAGGPSRVATRVSEVEEQRSPPAGFTLSQSYPNPFNHHTIISFTVPHECHVSLKIYDATGRMVTVLWDEETTTGHHLVTWSGKNQAGNSVSSGLYFYRMQAKSFVKTRSLLLLK